MGIGGRVLLRLFDDVAALLDFFGARGTWWEWRKRLWRSRLEERLAAGLARSVSDLIPPGRLASTLLISANVGMLLLVLAFRGVGGAGRGGLFGLLSPDGQALYDFGAKWAPAIAAGQIWRLVTASYLHAGLIHLLFNTYALASLGPLIEEAFGARRLFVLYTATGVAAFAASALVSPHSLSVGASGSIFGLLGFAFVYGRYRGGTAGRIISNHLMRFLVYAVLMLFIPGIDNAAHFGGLFAGGALGMVLSPGEPPDRAGRHLWDLLVVAALLITLGSFVLMALNQAAAILPA